MSSLSLRLSRAVAHGRACPTGPKTRAELLVTLLRKRATAHVHGAVELEAMLRAQILWSMPTIRAKSLASGDIEWVEGD